MRLRFFAAASLDTAMSSRPPYRGGLNPYRRGLCDKVSGINQFVSGDTHFQSVRDANRGGGTIDIHSQPYNHRPPPQFDARLSYSDFRPPQNSSRTHHPPRFHQNHSFRPPASCHNQPFRPQFQTPPLQNQQANTQFRNQKPLDYRNWEYAKIRPPPECDRFSILSYNILADYLATDHRNKLYFHIPRHMMDWEWRKRNIFFELGLWSADILCFQEVDRFHDLEEELKVRGYCGTWKMRTGNPVDGCAIFWRFSRFKLLHEESIEFNKLGLRDNVAQICVLERINQKDKRYNSAVPTSTGGSSKIVVGNIHVLYNPRRGEIKLGQVRVLLDRAYAVSKLWDDAPVVLCGDFNSTPKSPLYNYISERELELSGLPRDTLSGQAAAEIRPPRSFSPNLRTHTVDSQAMINDRQGKDYNIPTNNYHHAPIMTDDSKVRQGETVSNTQKDNDLNINNENAPAGKDFSVSHCIDSVLPDSSELSNNGRHSDEEISDNGEAGVYDHLEDLHFHVENSSVDESHKMHPVLLSEDGMHRKPTVHSHDEDTCSNVMSTEQEGLKASDIQCGELHQSNFCDKNDYAPNGSTTHMLSLSVTDKTSILPTTLEVNIPVVSTSELSPQVRDPDVNNNYVDGVRTTYNPSVWTPMEIETATGSADSTRMESPLKLISTYSEVEDSSGTRDAYGEPEVTSYNRCFLGTVDYIWRSEGLQTVRVLAPIPKHAMQWTNGFPTKKWGSDHIALVSELAFTKDVDK